MKIRIITLLTFFLLSLVAMKGSTSKMERKVLYSSSLSYIDNVSNEDVENYKKNKKSKFKSDFVLLPPIVI